MIAVTGAAGHFKIFTLDASQGCFKFMEGPNDVGNIIVKADLVAGVPTYTEIGLYKYDRKGGKTLSDNTCFEYSKDPGFFKKLACGPKYYGESTSYACLA